MCSTVTKKQKKKFKFMLKCTNNENLTIKKPTILILIFAKYLNQFYKDITDLYTSTKCKNIFSHLYHFITHY